MTTVHTFETVHVRPVLVETAPVVIGRVPCNQMSIAEHERIVVELRSQMADIERTSQRAVMDLEADCQLLRAEHNRLKAALQQQEGSNARLQKELDAMNQNRRNSMQDRRELEAFKVESDRRIANLDAEKEQIALKLRQKDAELDGLKRRIQEQDKLINSMKTQTVEIDRLKLENTRLATQVQQLTGEKQRMEADLTGLKALQSENSKLRSENERLGTDIDRLKLENAKLANQVQQSAGERQRMEADLNNLKTLQAENAKLRSENDRLCADAGRYHMLKSEHEALVVEHDRLLSRSACVEKVVVYQPVQIKWAKAKFDEHFEAEFDKLWKKHDSHFSRKIKGKEVTVFLDQLTHLVHQIYASSGVTYQWNSLRGAIQYDLDRNNDGKIDRDEAYAFVLRRRRGDPL